MTSLQIDNPSQQVQGGSGLGQSNTSPSKYDEVRQRMDQLRRHHNESAEIHIRTQPMIDEQIHEETVKYLKSGQVNGTKTKSQKPRAPKKSRSQSTGITSNSTPTANQNPPMSQTSHQVVSSTTNGYPTQNNVHQPVHQMSNGIVLQGQQQQHIQPHQQQQHRVAYYNPQQQQQSQQLPQQRTMQMQHHPNQMTTPPHQISHQHQNNFNYHQSNGIYQQRSQQHVVQHAQYQAQPHHMQHQQSPHVQQTYQQSAQPIHRHPNHQQMPNLSHVHQPQMTPGHSQHVRHTHQAGLTMNRLANPMPTDLDFSLQAGLECDIDSLIKHEMSMEGSLNFNYDLLLKLDNQYQHHHQT